jgi:hypothetical protein
MAGMFDPRLSPVPGSAWQAVFAVSAVLFARRAIHHHVQCRAMAQSSRQAHPVPHAVESAAMVYMLLPASPRPGGQEPGLTMQGMATATGGIRNPALTLVLALFMLGYILWTTDGLADHSPAAGPSPFAPRLTGCTKIAMSAAMGYMLLLTL